ncbi:hypothetical protein EI613_13995 [Azospirillum sp. 412522]|nr:hypothetical protein [Azospirillum sp. 412522]MBY6263013.1 hypothetical protein [Azospirillum sp. 412522]
MTKITGSQILLDATTGMVKPTGASARPSTSIASQDSPRLPLTDIVDLSDAARLKMGREKPTALSAERDQEIRRVGAAIPAMTDWANATSEYMGKAADAFRAAFGLSDSISITTGGAGTAMMDAIAASKGISKPKPPSVLAEAGESEVGATAEDRKAGAGFIGLSITDRQDSRFGQKLDIAFNRGTGIASEAMTLVRLDDRQSAGALAKLLQSDGGDDASMFAVTDGDSGPNAKVAAAIRSVGMDDAATSALAIIKAVGRYLPGSTGDGTGSQ